MPWFGFFNKGTKWSRLAMFILILILWGGYFALYANPTGVQFLYADF
jgi:hypothetical protein